jgi:hypothetical protein
VVKETRFEENESPMPEPHSTKAQLRPLFLSGPAGRLEALLNIGADGAACSALVCHPHPLHGGTMHNKAVFHIAKALNRLGYPVLRFNFRGAGLSQGEHDYGRGEVEDVRAAVEWLYAEFRLPMIFAGYSFGAATGLKAACPDPRISALISVGTPIGTAGQWEFDYDFLQGCRKPKLFISGGHDQFATRADLEALVASLSPPKELIFIDEADHFFEGELQALQQIIEGWAGRTL